MILFVDDEVMMGTFVLDLKLSGFEVELKTSVDEALKFLDEKREEVDLLILDISMPSGEAFKDAVDMGLRSGVHFYDRIRKTFERLPVIIFTNVVDETVVKKFQQEKYCRFFQKEDLFPFELTETVRRILEDKK